MLFQDVHPFPGEAVPPQADEVEAEDPGRPLAGHPAERQDVLGDHRAAAHEGKPADPAELVDAAHRPDQGGIADPAVAAEGGAVEEDRLIRRPRQSWATWE